MNRFSVTEKWKDRWFRRLPPAEKLIFLFLIDSCDNAGFFEMDFELLAFHTGLDLSEIEGACEGLARGSEGACEGLARGIEAHDDTIFIINFLKHQKNLPLNPSNHAHKQIIGILKDRSSTFYNARLILENSKIPISEQAPSKPLARGIGIGTGQGIGIGLGNRGESEGGSQNGDSEFEWVDETHQRLSVSKCHLTAMAYREISRSWPNRFSDEAWLRHVCIESENMERGEGPASPTGWLRAQCKKPWPPPDQERGAPGDGNKPNHVGGNELLGDWSPTDDDDSNMTLAPPPPQGDRL